MCFNKTCSTEIHIQTHINLLGTQYKINGCRLWRQWLCCVSFHIVYHVKKLIRSATVSNCNIQASAISCYLWPTIYEKENGRENRPKIIFVFDLFGIFNRNLLAFYFMFQNVGKLKWISSYSWQILCILWLTETFTIRMEINTRQIITHLCNEKWSTTKKNTYKSHHKWQSLSSVTLQCLSWLELLGAFMGP